MTHIRAIRLLARDARRLAGLHEAEAPPPDPFGVPLRRLVTLRVGRDRVELADPGAALDDLATDDVRFQNVARIAPDMASAHARLGTTRAGGSVDAAPEQAALDGVDAPRVAVTRLEGGEGPGLGLLCHGPATRRTQADDRDPRATRTVGAPDPIPPRDPDGHRWIADTAQAED